MRSNLSKIFLIFWLLSGMSAHAETNSSWDDWKMRTELAVEAEVDKKPIYYFETAQPLYRSSDRQNTLLTQFRVSDADRFTERRNIFNLGFGYRHLMAENSAMAGIKLFYDLESKYNLSRWSLGVDLSWNIFDVYANKYYAIADTTLTNDRGSEKPLNGYDVDFAVQIPYMPWAKAHFISYQWIRDNNTENIIGKKLSLEVALSLNWTIELGHQNDNIATNENFMILRYRWAGFVREHQNAVNNFWSSSAFEQRDMRDFTLERMRRQNSFVVERVEP